MYKAKYFLYLITGISLILVSGIVHDDLCRKIQSQSDTLETNLKRVIKQNNSLISYKDIKIKAFPFFRLRMDTLANKIDLNDLTLSEKIGFYEIDLDGKEFYLMYSFELPLSLKIDNLIKGNYYSYQKAINVAQKKSGNVFLLSIFNDPVVCYSVDGKLNILDSELNEYSSIQTLIDYRFGSLNNYKSYLKRIYFEDAFLKKITSLDDAIRFFTNYPYNYMSYNIYEPDSLSNAILFQIKCFVKITDYQEKLLRSKLIETIKKNEFGKKDFGKLLYNNKLDEYVDRYKSVIKYTIKSVLLYDQYSIYLSNENLYDDCNDKANEIINEYFNSKQKLASDSLIRTQIFNIKY